MMDDKRGPQPSAQGVAFWLMASPRSRRSAQPFRARTSPSELPVTVAVQAYQHLRS